MDGCVWNGMGVESAGTLTRASQLIKVGMLGVCVVGVRQCSLKNIFCLSPLTYWVCSGVRVWVWVGVRSKSV